MSVLQVICVTLIVIVTVAAIVSFARGIFWMVRRLREAQPAPQRVRPIGRRLALTLRTVFTHETFKGRPLVRIAHWVVMMSFLLLLMTLVSAFVQVFDPTHLVPVLEDSPIVNGFVELTAWIGLIGIIYLIAVRTRGEGRFIGSNRSQAHFVEAVIAIVLACILLLHALNYAQAVTLGTPGVTAWTFPFTAPLGATLVGAHGLGNAIVIVSTVKILTSMLWLIVVGVQVSMGVAWHRFLAFVNIYGGRNADGAKALGPLEPIQLNSGPLTDLDQLEDIEPDELAPTYARDLTWKRVTDLLTCTECGRCQELCPAWASGKPLSPKLLMAQLRDHYVAQANFVTALGPDATVEDAIDATTGRWARDLMPHSGDTFAALREAGIVGPEGVPIEPVPLVGENGVVAPETLWACTHCGACVDACPVNIEILDQIVDLRREQALLEAAFPQDLRKPMKDLERRGNPFGQAARKRMEWARNLDFEVPVIGEDAEDASAYEYLFWVGCAGAFDDRGRATSASVATLLHHAGVKFAVLGSGESCTGDPARRAGNEVLFMTLAAGNIETLDAAQVRRIVVSCAHCFNTLAREYPQFGGNYEVVHYTQLLQQLVADGRLHLQRDEAGTGTGTVVYHDACFLGRHNGEYAAPRALLDAVTAERAELPRAFERALCCGAGGARAFMEEDPNQRVAKLRMAEAAQAGATTVATACPFCTTMLASAGATVEADTDAARQPIQISDIATILVQHLD